MQKIIYGLQNCVGGLKVGILENFSNTFDEKFISISNLICGLMVRMFVSCEVDRGIEPQWGQTKGNKIDICCF